MTILDLPGPEQELLLALSPKERQLYLQLDALRSYANLYASNKYVDETLRGVAGIIVGELSKAIEILKGESDDTV